MSRETWPFVVVLVAALLATGPVCVWAQGAAPENWLRLEGYSREQRQALRQEQKAFTRSVEPIDLEQRRELEQRYFNERLKQSGVQNRQRARESTIRARSAKRPVPESQTDRGLRNQQYRTEQRRFRLQQQIERRSSTYGGVRPAPPRPTVHVGP